MHSNDSRCECAHCCCTSFALAHLLHWRTCPTPSTWVTAPCTPASGVSNAQCCIYIHQSHMSSRQKSQDSRLNLSLSSGKFCAMVKVDEEGQKPIFLSFEQETRKGGKSRINANIQKSKVGLGPRWIQVSPPLCNLPRAFTLKSLPTHQYHQSIMFSL